MLCLTCELKGWEVSGLLKLWGVGVSIIFLWWQISELKNNTELFVLNNTEDEQVACRWPGLSVSLCPVRFSGSAKGVERSLGEVLHYSRVFKLLFYFYLFMFCHASIFLWIPSSFAFCFELVCPLDALTCIMQDNAPPGLPFSVPLHWPRMESSSD